MNPSFEDPSLYSVARQAYPSASTAASTSNKRTIPDEFDQVSSAQAQAADSGVIMEDPAAEADDDDESDESPKKKKVCYSRNTEMLLEYSVCYVCSTCPTSFRQRLVVGRSK
jgi:hypothetical protein